MTSIPIPQAVRRAYALPAADAELDVLHVPSLINQTYIVRRRDRPELDARVLQRLHPVFGARVHVDIEAVTQHLAAKGLVTPRLIHTLEDQLWVEDASTTPAAIWRALTHVDGITLHQTRDLACLESAAALLGRFQRALTDLEHRFVHERPLHDTRRHLGNLRAALASERARGDATAQELGARILAHAEQARVDFQGLPLRTIHGDPKLSNVMFERERVQEAKCMIDLDTVGRGHVAYELGDALRSWCNPAGEDTLEARVDVGAFSAVMRGYAGTCPETVTPDELASGVDGLETVSVELASRFAADVVNDSYWGWDAARFPSRREHNLVRARGQLALSLSVRAQRAELMAALQRAIEARPRP